MLKLPSYQKTNHQNVNPIPLNDRILKTVYTDYSRNKYNKT